MSKTIWPELVGMPWKEAEGKIRQEYPNMSIQVVPEGGMMTMDYREDRVRLIINKEDKVVQPPSIG